MSTDHAAVYRAVRHRVAGLVRDLPDAELDRDVPATPGWRVRDVVAHLAGSTADIVSGTLDGVAGPAWTQAQVDARRDAPLADVLAEWDRCSEEVEPLVASFPPLMRAMFLTDAATHEQDLRGALGRPGERDGDAVAYAFRGVSGGIGAQRGDAGALVIRHEDGERVVGTGEPTATLRTTRFEVVRAAVGRRSASQIAAWDWEGDARPDTVVLAAFAPPRDTDLEE